jgi:ABC-2 type transport system permease protein
MMNYVLCAYTLLNREVVRFLRQRHRIVGALGTPVLFWILIGSGLGRSFRAPGAAAATSGADYLKYFFPGTIMLILLFTAIFSTISIIEDRREGFLQGVLVAPVPRSAIVLGKLLGGTVLAALQGLLFVLLAPFVGGHLSLASGAYLIATLVLMSFALTGLGFVIAWRLDSTQGFHAIMNLFLMPLWFLSGALFPVDGAPAWLRRAMQINPLTYSLSSLQIGLYRSSASALPWLQSPSICLEITAAFAVLMFVACAVVGSRRQSAAA